SSAHPPQRAPAAPLPDDGRIEKRLTLLAGKRIEARRDDAPDARRQLAGVDPVLGERSCKLLEEQRIPLSGLRNLQGRLRIGSGNFQQTPRELLRMLLCEWLERQRGGRG